MFRYDLAPNLPELLLLNFCNYPTITLGRPLDFSHLFHHGFLGAVNFFHSFAILD